MAKPKPQPPMKNPMHVAAVPTPAAQQPDFRNPAPNAPGKVLLSNPMGL